MEGGGNLLRHLTELEGIVLVEILQWEVDRAGDDVEEECGHPFVDVLIGDDEYFESCRHADDEVADHLHAAHCEVLPAIAYVIAYLVDHEEDHEGLDEAVEDDFVEEKHCLLFLEHERVVLELIHEDTLAVVFVLLFLRVFLK